MSRKDRKKKADKRVSLGGISPSEEKKPRFKDPLIEGSPLSWRFSSCDRDGPFSWAVLQDPQYKAIVEKLHEFETKSKKQSNAESYGGAESDEQRPVR